VRLFTRRGYDWTERYPAIASAAAKLRARSFTLEEALVRGKDGVAGRGTKEPKRARGLRITAIDNSFVETGPNDLQCAFVPYRKERVNN
jgi:bifunctional non-homologous end joining protein LigD